MLVKQQLTELKPLFHSSQKPTRKPAASAFKYCDWMKVIESLNSYFESLNSCFERSNSYFQSLNSYFQSLNSYFQSLNSYFQSLNSYFQSLNSYFQRLNSYFESLNSYFQSLNSYFQSLNSYFQSLNSYFELVLEASLRVGFFDHWKRALRKSEELLYLCHLNSAKTSIASRISFRESRHEERQLNPQETIKFRSSFRLKVAGITEYNFKKYKTWKLDPMDIVLFGFGKTFFNQTMNQ